MTDRAGHGRRMEADGHEFAGGFGPSLARIGWADHAGEDVSQTRAAYYRDEVRDEVARWRGMAARGERVTAWRE